MSDLEYILTHTHKEEMVAYVQQHPETFEELIQLALAHKNIYSWRAAWLLWDCAKPNDPRLQPYLPDFVAALKEKEDNHAREICKILYLMEIEEAVEGELFDICVEFWTKINKKPAVRLNAFKLLLKIAAKHPELRDEISFLVEDHYLEELSPGVKHSIAKMIKAFFKS